MSFLTPTIYIIRHGEALHNVQHPYSDIDPPLTTLGINATKGMKLPIEPDLILISPMTRTIQSALNIFPILQDQSASTNPIPVQIWPDLREAHDAPCNIGHSRAQIQANFPMFDFKECKEKWEYPEHTSERATERAERVRKRLNGLSESGAYQDIVIITHRGFTAFLVKGRRFDVCERRAFRLATEKEARDKNVRWGKNCDTLEEQDYGPTILVLHKEKEEWEAARDDF